jgi:uncharacterized membrane protein HdeD (DUF308 family)
MEDEMTVSAFAFQTERSPWWLHLIRGLFSIILGLLLLTTPAKTVVLLVLALGIFWIVEGLMTLVWMFVDHSAWGWKLFIGLLSVFAGMVILRHPLASALTIPAFIILLMGLQGIISGIFSLVLAFKGGGLGSGIFGALSILFGLVLVANYASLGAIAALVLVSAIFLLVGGVVQIYQAFQQRQ